MRWRHRRSDLTPDDGAAVFRCRSCRERISTAGFCYRCKPPRVSDGERWSDWGEPRRWSDPDVPPEPLPWDDR